MKQISISQSALLTRYSIVGFLALLLGGGGVYSWFKLFTDFETIDEADDLVVNYVNNDDLRKVTGNAFGGTFQEDSIFQPGSDRVGVRLWYCYNDINDPRYPKFFLASERIPVYTFPKEDDKPYYPTLGVPVSFDYSATGHLAKAEGYKYISTYQEPTGQTKSITRDEVIQFSDAFKASVKHLPVFHKYKYAFFFYDNVNHFERLTSQKDAEFVRYYFSFDDKNKVNKIRVLLVASRQDGYNVLTSSPTKSNTPIMLQKSVPPPPEN